jgi:hypothetical protein
MQCSRGWAQLGCSALDAPLMLEHEVEEHGSARKDAPSPVASATAVRHSRRLGRTGIIKGAGPHRSRPSERPSGERVPSGKMCTQSPAASRCSAARMPGWSTPFPRSTGSVCDEAENVSGVPSRCEAFAPMCGDGSDAR